MQDFLEERRKVETPNKWFMKCIWYFYQFVMIILVITVISFIIYEWKVNKIHIHLNPDQMFLTFVGFLFAFAGINIYSIFNTNIEEEKRQLHELIDEHKQTITNLNRKLWNFYENNQKSIKIIQLSDFTIRTNKFNSQLFNWFFEMETNIKSYSVFLKELEQYDEKLYIEARGDMIDLSRGIWYLLKQYKEKITDENSNYFQEAEAQYAKTEFLNVVDDMIKVLYQLQNGIFPDETLEKPIQEDITWKDWISIKFPKIGNIIKTFA